MVSQIVGWCTRRFALRMPPLRSMLMVRPVGFAAPMTAIAAVALSLASTAPSLAQANWPSRPVTLVVPYTAGGFSDIVGRLFADFFSQKFGQPFVVDNRPGGNGVVGAGYVANAQPDGQTILLTSAAQVVSIPLLQKVSYDPDSLVPVSNIASFPYLLATKYSLPATSLEQFVAYAKANPGKLNYASAGIGSLSHMMAAMFLNRVGLDVVHIPYKSANPATTALVAGQVDMVFIGAAELVPHLNGDKVRVLATSSAKRLALLPNVPAVSEVYPGLQFESWNGLMAPPGTPQAIIDRLTQATQEGARSPAITKRLSDLNIVPLGTTAAEFATTLKQDKSFYPDAIKAAGLKPEL
jgi:tripartite-type tricarboxylate transporter receptor subunit TctC